MSRPPTSGRGESQVAFGVCAAAGKSGGRRRGELRAQLPDPPGNGSCLRCACGGALQVGAALMLKGNRVEKELFAFDALQCDN